MNAASGSGFGSRKTAALALVMAIVAIAGVLVYQQLNPPAPCCAPEPAKGQLFLESYNFQTSGSSGSLFAVFGVFEGQNVTVTGASFDGTALTKSNSNLSSSCGTRTYGTPPAQWTGYVCTLAITFGPYLPAPPAGSVHDLKVITSAGVTSSFQVTGGSFYHATSTAAYPVIGVSGTVYQGCVGSQPLHVTFTDESGARYTANVNATGSTWSYSLSLANGHNYVVTVSYEPVVPNASTQTASAGSLDLATESPTYTYNISC